uniref:Uncharacterized protein n=1 Tax=Trypanosoma congolense (strain IL3000) TaxID=1068625 RepID=G0UNC5_TRYCI|nr:hypothetical protein, unlikely [Trypanosoma congolense IL3000]
MFLYAFGDKYAKNSENYRFPYRIIRKQCYQYCERHTYVASVDNRPFVLCFSLNFCGKNAYHWYLVNLVLNFCSFWMRNALQVFERQFLPLLFKSFYFCHIHATNMRPRPVAFSNCLLASLTIG